MSRKPKAAMFARNVTVAGRRTSLRMEPEMWDALQEVAEREHLTLHDLCTAVAKKRGLHSMTAAIRVYLLNYFRTAATDAGHRKAKHGKSGSGRAGNGKARSTKMRRSKLPRGK